MTERSPSIRIETEQVDAPGSVGEVAVNKRPPLGPALFVALLAGVVVVVLLLLRPDAGQTADGSSREAPPATTDAPVDGPEEAESSTPLEPLEAQVIDAEAAIRAVVPDDVGYLGLLDIAAPRAAPPLLSSFDGVRWSGTEATVIEPDDLDLVRSRFASFVGLRSTELGFTILRVRQEFAEPGRISTGNFVVDRLASPDGVAWRPDESFDELLVRQAMPDTTGSGDLLLSTRGRLPSSSATPPPEITPSNLDCTPRGSSLDLLFLEDCSTSATDATPADADAGLVPCAVQYLRQVELGSAMSEFLLIDSDATSDTFFGRGLLTAPQVLPESGFLAALTRPIPERPADCEVLASEARPLAIHVWQGPGVGGYNAVSNLEAAGVTESELATAVSLGPLGNGILVATTDSLVRIELNGRVERLSDLRSIDIRDGVPTSLPVAGGTELVDVRDGVLRQWTVTEAGTEMSEMQLSEQSGFARVTFADEDVIVTFSPNTDRAIRLGAGG